MANLEILRREKDYFLRTDPHSPLTPDQRAQFTGLPYFPENPDLRLTVKVDRFENPERIQMQTSTGDIQDYERFGRFKVSSAGQHATLTIYRNEYGYFLPFVDSLAGRETYGAGRYLEPEEQPDGTFLIDFNLAYNPYCAYNENWSCPLTPAENRLRIPIRAGEKIFKEEV